MYYLRALKAIGEAEWNAGVSEIRACLKGTRESVLKDIDDWLKSLETPPIYWLTGSAGTGKSCISYSVCKRYSEEGILGATFFFSRDQDTRSTVDHVFRTIAYRLCVDYPETLQPHILKSLKRDLTLFDSLPERQFRELVVNSIRAVSASLPISILLVIDALDECQGRKGESAIAQLISLLVEQLADRTAHLKVFVTSRPENPLPVFSRRNVKMETLTELIHIFDVEASIPESDLKLYVTHQMTELAASYRKPDEQTWPLSKDIRAVLMLAGNLFISAATVLRMLELAEAGAEPDPRGTLQRLQNDLGLKEYRGAQSIPVSGLLSNHVDHLDRLYREVLRVAVERHSTEDSRENIRRLLAFVVLSFHPLPGSDIGKLLGFIAKPLIPVLHPVLGSPSSEVPLRALHTSFHDFITNPRRCTVASIRYIDPRQSHFDLASACLLELKRLHRNLLELVQAESVPEISDEAVRHRISNARLYATRYWDMHISRCAINGNLQDEYLLMEIEAFANTNLMHWIEALGYLGFVTEGQISLENVIRVLPVSFVQ
jgi:hypothetical protein